MSENRPAAAESGRRGRKQPKGGLEVPIKIVLMIPRNSAIIIIIYVKMLSTFCMHAYLLIYNNIPFHSTIVGLKAPAKLAYKQAY